MKFISTVIFILVVMLSARFMFDAPAWGIYLSGLAAMNYMALINLLSRP